MARCAHNVRVTASAVQRAVEEVFIPVFHTSAPAYLSDASEWIRSCRMTDVTTDEIVLDVSDEALFKVLDVRAAEEEGETLSGYGSR